MPTEVARTFEFEHEGKKLTVPLPDTVLTRDEVEAQYVALAKHNQVTTKLRKEAEGKVDRASLIEDEAFLSELAEKKRDWFAEKLGTKKASDQSDVEKLQAQWQERETKLRQKWMDTDLKPTQEKLEKALTLVGGLRRQKLDNDVMQAAVDAGVVDDMYDPLKSWFGSRVKFDDEYDGWFVVGADGEFEATTAMKKGKAPYKTPGEHLAELKQAGKFPSWFKAEARGGAGYKGAGGAKGSEPTTDEKIAEAEKAGKWTEAIRLKVQRTKELDTARAQSGSR
jgi:hypothetical protein